MEPRHPWLAPGGLVFAAFTFRIALGHIFTYYGGDAPGYTAIGKNLAAGHGYSLAAHSPYVATDIRLPGYPAVRGHEKVRTYGHEKSALMATRSPRFWPREVRTPR
jgi:hypothetical protein